MIKQINWTQIHEFWKANTFPNRAEIHMRNLVSIDSLPDNGIQANEVRFWGAFEGEELAGVVSGFMTSPTDYRIRGLDVKPAFKAQGFLKALLATAEQEGRSWGCTRAWDVAGEKAVLQMANNGYTVYGDFTASQGEKVLKVIFKPLA